MADSARLLELLAEADPVDDDTTSTLSPSGVPLRSRVDDRIASSTWNGLRGRLPGPAVAVAAMIAVVLGGLGLSVAFDLWQANEAPIADATTTTASAPATTEAPPPTIPASGAEGQPLDLLWGRVELPTSANLTSIEGLADLPIGLAVIGEEWIGVDGHRPAMWIVDDSLAATQIALAPDVFPPALTLTSMAASGDLVAAVGYLTDDDSSGLGISHTPWAARSTDGGVTWERTEIDAPGTVETVIATDHGFLAGGTRLWASDDASKWETVHGDFAESPYEGVSSIVQTEDGFVAVGRRMLRRPDGVPVQAAAVWFSADGRQWTPADPEPGVLYDDGDLSSLSTFEMRDVITTPVGIVAVGVRNMTDTGGVSGSVDPVVWTSPDGVRWTRHITTGLSGDYRDELTAVAWLGDQLVAVGTDIAGWSHIGAGMWTSADGVTWSRYQDVARLFDGATFTDISDYRGWPAITAFDTDGPGLWIATGHE